MGQPGWVTPERAAEMGMVRAHNGVGWCWVAKEQFRFYAEDTAKAVATGEEPSRYWETFREDPC